MKDKIILKDIVDRFRLAVIYGESLLDREITGGYVSDILSDVLTYAEPGNIWVTRQIHLNIVPIASARDISAIIIVSGRQLDPETLAKAKSENLPILGTPINAFQLVGKLYQAGIKGSDEGTNENG